LSCARFHKRGVVTWVGVSRRGDCRTKRAFPNRLQAEQAIERMAEQKHLCPDSLKVYRCKRKPCRKWHVANSITKGRKGKRA
jgi:hypothetical protein